MRGFKYVIPLAVICFFIAIASCKKNKGSDNNGGGGGGGTEQTITKVNTILTLHQGAGFKYKEVLSATNDTLEALIQTANWILKQPSVKTAYLLEDNIIDIVFQNGLQSSIFIIPVDKNGQHLIRGGGKGSMKQYMLGTTSADHLIGNKKVMVFIPYLEEFYAGPYPFKSKLKDQDVVIRTNADADIPTINTFKDYGFIIIDSHGSTDGFTILTKVAELDIPSDPGKPALTDNELKALLSKANNVDMAKIESGELELAFNINRTEGVANISCNSAIKVTDKYIRGLPKLDKAVVLANHCFSGFTYSGPSEDNMMEAWKSIGAISYYGYAYNDNKSAKVANEFCVQMEDSLITNLVANDTTGMAHFANDVVQQFQKDATRRTGGIKISPEPGPDGVLMMSTVTYTKEHPLVLMELNFKHFIDPRYQYDSCGTITDERDKEVYKVACIGDQQWMAENLRYNAPGSRFYNDDPANGPVYGRLYKFSTMMAGAGIVSPTQPGPRGICPQGWHLPSLKDFAQMRAALIAANGSTGLGTQLKAKSSLWLSDPTLSSPLRNESGMAFLPSGSLSQTGASSFFWGKGESADFFLASPYSSTTPGETALIYLKSNSADIGVDEREPGDDMMPCRCVKD